MPSEILSKYGSFTALTITLASLADGGGRQATAVTGASPVAQKVRIWAKVTTGTTPTVNSTIQFFISRADDDASELASGATGVSDAAYSNTKPELDWVESIQVTATSDKTYIKEFIIDDPGTDWRLVVFNETGAALNATGSNHEIGYRTVTKEGQ